jgi:signal transduction histidine kinase
VPALTKPKLQIAGSGLHVWLRALLFFLLATPGNRADPTAHLRVFRTADGLAESAVTSISLSPRGNLWIKHGEADEIGVFDGYVITNAVPSPGKNNFRVHESRSGQLWSLYQEGVARFKGTRWIQHPIPEIRAEIQADPLRQIHQISLIPAERDHVLFLVSDRLMDFDAAKSRTTVLRTSGETKLGRFFEMTEARDGGVWISGQRGLAYLPGPVRKISRGTEWREFLPPPDFGAGNFQRPFEDDRGGITTLGSSPLAPGKRGIVRFDGTNWFQQPVTNEVLRQAWTVWDGTVWGCSINSLLRFDRSDPDRFVRADLWVGQYRDVLTETNGVFWLGTSEGLVRYAPFLWHTPDEADEFRSLVHAILQDRAKSLWFASAEGLIQHRENQWRLTRWPENMEINFSGSDGLFELPDGRLAASAGESPLLFDPAAGKFTPILHPDGRKLRLIGQFASGALAFRSESGDPARQTPVRIDEFDGREFRVWREVGEKWPVRREFEVLFTASNGDVWLGGLGGLIRFHNGNVRFFPTDQGFRDERALCLTEIGDGKIWCGGSGRIQEFNGKAWSTVRFGFDRVHHLAKTHDGKIWAATGRGLFAWQNGSWMSHGVEDGLPSPGIVKLLEDGNERFWAATTRGLSLYHPETDTSPPRTLPPEIDSPETITTDGKVRLAFYGKDRWDNTPVERLLYSCRLDENAWLPYSDSPVKTFDRLGPGKHRVEVRAMDRNWNEDAATALVEFSVLLPWYQEPRLIAVTIAGMALVLLFAALAVNRHRRLIRSYAEVEKIVALRTRELERANEELLHSQKMKALGTLAAGIAHDFNNILSIIKGSAQIIERNPGDTEKIHTRVSRIKTVVEQGSGIVKSMLGLSRVTEKDFVPSDLTALIGDTVRLLGDRLPPGAGIRFEPGADLPSVRAPGELIQQMIYNLVLNAVDAMSGAGEVVLRTELATAPPKNVSLHPAPAPHYANIIVEDTGSGIAPEILPRIFEPFFTTKALSSRRGTGLGLSMVYELAKELGYGLHVRSTPGEGTTFTILIPLQTGVPRRNAVAEPDAHQ